MKVCIQCLHSVNPIDSICDSDECDCICFIPDFKTKTIDFNDWKESALLQVLDLLLYEEGGEISIQSKTGKNCTIQVRFSPEIGFSITSQDGRA